MSSMLAFPNFIDSGFTVSFSGGSWEATLPLTNLKDARLAKVARSTDDATASTQFDLDLGAARYVRVFAIPKHNLSLAATYRIRGSNTAGDFSSPEYDTGTLNVYPVIYPSGSIPFGHPSFVTGKLTQAEYDDGYVVSICHVTDEPESARYWRFEFTDTSNADGYVELSRLFIAFAYEFPMGAGASMGWTTTSTSTETDGGAFVHNTRARRRTATFTIPDEDSDEALVHIFDAARKYGTTKQMYFVWDEDDTAQMSRRSFPALLRELTPLEWPYSGGETVNMPIQLVEEL